MSVVHSRFTRNLDTRFITGLDTYKETQKLKSSIRNHDVFIVKTDQTGINTSGCAISSWMKFIVKDVYPNVVHMESQRKNFTHSFSPSYIQLLLLLRSKSCFRLTSGETNE